MGSSVNRMFTGSALDSSAKRLFRDDVDMFSDSTSQKHLKEEQDDGNIKRLSREELEESLKVEPWKFPRDDPNVIMETPKRRSSREELDAFVDFRKISREELDVCMDTQRVKIFSDRKDACMEKKCPSRKSSRDELDNYSDSHSGKIFRETEISLEAASRKPPRDDSDFATSAQRRRTFRDKRDVSLDAATRKISRDEFDMATESQRRRAARDFRIDNSMDTPTGQIPVDRLDFPVDPRRISREEHAAMDVGRIGQPDITTSSLMLRRPNSEPLSRLVYDGILEKAYSTSMTAPSTTDFPLTIHELPQGMVGLETTAHLTPRGSPKASPPESRSGSREKTKKSSKLKSLFQKKKKDTASSSPVGTPGGLQRM